MRWPEGVHRPRCNNAKVYELKKRPFHWVCKAKECGGRNGYRFSVITKTVFENTNYPLRTWFQVKKDANPYTDRRTGVRLDTIAAFC
jgi:hypothetical protein